MVIGDIFDEVLVLQNNSDLKDFGDYRLGKNRLVAIPANLVALIHGPNFSAELLQCFPQKLVPRIVQQRLGKEANDGCHVCLNIVRVGVAFLPRVQEVIGNRISRHHDHSLYERLVTGLETIGGRLAATRYQ